jgi:hypothetical protein
LYPSFLGLEAYNCRSGVNLVRHFVKRKRRQVAIRLCQYFEKASLARGVQLQRQVSRALVAGLKPDAPEACFAWRKPFRRNDVEAMGPAQKCRRMSSMVELVVAIVAFVSACIFLAHAIEVYRA